MLQFSSMAIRAVHDSFVNTRRQTPRLLMKASREIADVCTSYGLPPMNLADASMYAEPLNLVFLPKAFQPAGDTFDERYLFVGPSTLPRRQATDVPLGHLSTTRPLLYISLGTRFTNPRGAQRGTQQVSKEDPNGSSRKQKSGKVEWK
jgi:UDP:flavonoid glycosyltransferase YjiC (YdhE family)